MHSKAQEMTVSYYGKGFEGRVGATVLLVTKQRSAQMPKLNGYHLFDLNESGSILLFEGK
jgi:hypothetical protein